MSIRNQRLAFPGSFSVKIVLSKDRSQWPAAVSSLTVARQRGTHTRFPVFAERQRRAFRRTWERSQKL